MEQTTHPGADLNDLLGAVDRAVVHIKGLRHAALVESGAEGLNECVHILGQEELAMAAHPRSVIQEGDEPGLNRKVCLLNIRAIECIGLPHVVGVSFGEGQAQLIGAVLLGLKQFVFFDQPAKGIGRNLRAGQQPPFDAQPIEQSAAGRFAMDFGQHRPDRFQNVLRLELARFSLIGAGFVFHHGDAIFLIAPQPGLDRFPGELARAAFLIGESHLADGLQARLDGLAWGHVNGSEHAHFQISGGIFHWVLCFGFAAGSETFSVCRQRLFLFTAAG